MQPPTPSAPPASWAAAADTIFGDRLPLAMRYAELLGTSGVVRGLIGPREADRLWERHLLNSAVVAELIPTGVEVVDVGSGAGLPGLPVAITRSDLRVILVEPLLRRTTWLTEVVTALALPNVTVLRGRAEELGAEHAVITARAVAPLPRLLGMCVPHLAPGGVLLAVKGSSASVELAAAAAPLASHGVREASVVTCGTGLLEPPTTVIRVVAGEASRRRRST